MSRISSARARQEKQRDEVILTILIRWHTQGRRNNTVVRMRLERLRKDWTLWMLAVRNDAVAGRVRDKTAMTCFVQRWPLLAFFAFFACAVRA